MVYMESFTVLTCSWSTRGQMQTGKPQSILSSNPSPHLSCHKYQLFSTVSHSSQRLLPISCFCCVIHCSIWSLPYTYIHKNVLNSHFQFVSQSQDERYYKKHQTLMDVPFIIHHYGMKWKLSVADKNMNISFTLTSRLFQEALGPWNKDVALSSDHIGETCVGQHSLMAFSPQNCLHLLSREHTEIIVPTSFHYIFQCIKTSNIFETDINSG